VQPVSAGARHYDKTTILFHWTTAILVALQWLGAQLIDVFPRAPRVDARSVHIVAGVALGIILAGRIVWRATHGRRLPPADRGALHIIAQSTH
jgi:cytochrome b561